MISRRGILSGLIAAPSIVLINNIMPVKAFAAITNPSTLELIDLIKAEIAEALKPNLFEPIAPILASNMDNLRNRDPRLLNFLVCEHSLPNVDFSVYYTEAMVNNTTRLNVSFINHSIDVDTIIYNHI
jgi:hypothetical protein